MRNLEIKVPLKNPQEAMELALQAGAVFSSRFIQVDTYFNTQQGRLKIRDFCNGTGQLIGYHREESGESDRWSRWDAQTLENPDTMLRILSGTLGVRGVVKKTRSLFLFREARIHMDKVEGLGDFLEIESIAGDENGAAEETFDILLKSLKIDKNSQILKSYIDLLTDHEH